MPSSFDQWADVYDSVYSYVTEDIPFYIDEARSAGGSVLELGCGTARVAIPIAQAGIEIVGLDSSPAMLEVARRKAEKAPGARGLRLVEADMRDFSLDEVFDLVTIPFRGFLSLLSVEDQVQTLANVRTHLAPGGKLAFNIFVPDLNMLVQEGDVAYHLRDVTDSDTGRRLVLWHQSAYDNHNQIINARVIVDNLEADGVVGTRFYRDFQLRYSYRWEIRHLLEVCGFEIVDLFGDFERSPFDEASTEMVWVARVPG